MSAAETPLVVKARLANVGNGFLEVSNDAIRFNVETGRLRKRRKISCEIKLGEIESIERQENDVIVLWKETTSVFVVEQDSQAETVYGRIASSLEERKKDQENKVTANKVQNEIVATTTNALEVADSLFNLLKSLHGQVDWKLVEMLLSGIVEKAKKLSTQSSNSVSLDVMPLSVAVQQYSPNEIAERAFDVLRSLYEHFDRLDSIDGKQSHPNQHDSKLAIQTIYLLNDMALGAVVGDENVGKEGDELFKVFAELARLPGSKIDINAAKSSLDKLSVGKHDEASEEIKLMLQQPKEPMSSTNQSTCDQSA